MKRVFGLNTLVIYGVGDILGAGIYTVEEKLRDFPALRLDFFPRGDGSRSACSFKLR